MTYKEAIIKATQKLALDSNTIFMGYNVKNGLANGTFKGISDTQLFETPVAENLILGLATGMSLQNYLPIVYIERFDFILNALDSIVNHLDKIYNLSHGNFKPRVILKVAVGIKNKPLYSGPTHTQDFTEAMQHLVSFPVIILRLSKQHIFDTYEMAKNSSASTMIIEEKELYNETIN